MNINSFTNVLNTIRCVKFFCQRQCCGSEFGGSVVYWRPGYGSLLLIKDYLLKIQRNFRKKIQYFITKYNDLLPGNSLTTSFSMAKNCQGKLQSADQEPKEIFTDPQH